MFTELIKKEAKLKKAKEFAISKGGECLSNEYINCNQKMFWRCQNGHEWEAKFRKVIGESQWCKRCLHDTLRMKNGLEKAKEYALLNDGECLSNEYVNRSIKLKWQCSEGHIWDSDYNHVVERKHWCPQCVGRFSKEEGLLKAKEHAIFKNGECLSNEYFESKKQLKWKCSEGHTWKASYSKVINSGNWCPKCFRKKLGNTKRNKNGLSIAKKHAVSKGGECLSSKYVSSKKQLKWKCSERHIWKASYESVFRNGSWCPICSNYYYKEHKVRDLLEYILATKFEKSKLDWNINPKTNKILELDGYSEELKIAFEFQGEHHYSVGVFKNSKEDLEYIKYKDEIKKQNCAKNGVNLIIIDDKFKLNQQKEIVDYIVSLLNEKNIKIKKEIKQEDISSIFKKNTPQQKIYFFKAKEYAEGKGGECLSSEYINYDTKLKWQCSKNHIWESSYHNTVKGGGWCHECSGRLPKEKGILQAKNHALSKGGVCLSSEYIYATTKLKWQCSEGHIWDASYSSIVKSGTWCPKCVGHLPKEEKLHKAKEYAFSKGGECLSDEYFKSSKQLKWKCSEGHIWNASFSNVINNGTWCPHCYRENRKKQI